MNKSRFSNQVNIRNKKASYEFEFIDKYVAGLVLKGTEIKSIKEGKASLQEAYCYISKGEMFIKSMHIAVYEQGTFNNHEPLRERKLLLNRTELDKIESKSQEKGLTIIPTRLFINDRGYAKLELALAKGKKIHDKRDSIKEKDVKRELERNRY
ncbi:MAG: SsrA-binding protein SmpB [Reichenbachiella sp.]|uniref:SsrA-binding protein SmpB n=1 Tax=Reichenbachiella sp. TaxID=2184521 RepID=UPI003265A413